MVRIEAKERESEPRREAERRNAGIDTAEAGLLSNSEQDRQEAEHGSKTGDEDRARNGALFQLQEIHHQKSEGLERRMPSHTSRFRRGPGAKCIQRPKQMRQCDLDTHYLRMKGESEGLAE